MCPYVDVLVVTGTLPESNQGLVNCRFLRKPFLPGVLLETMNDIFANQCF
jgi:hypothetical protein